MSIDIWGQGQIEKQAFFTKLQGQDRRFAINLGAIV